MNYLDLVTAVLGLAYILFEYRASRWMWVVGIAMQLLGIALYYQKGLYADCAMEFYYLAMSIYGLVRWTKRGERREKSEEWRAKSGERIVSLFEKQKIKHTSLPSPLSTLHSSLSPLPFLLSTAILLWIVIWWLLTTFTDSSVPVADSFTTSLSIVGIWMLARKILEQWFVWIAVDVVTSVLYFYKDIPFKASLYALYVVIAIFGYRKWKRDMNKEYSEKSDEKYESSKNNVVSLPMNLNCYDDEQKV